MATKLIYPPSYEAMPLDGRPLRVEDHTFYAEAACYAEAAGEYELKRRKRTPTQVIWHRGGGLLPDGTTIADVQQLVHFHMTHKDGLRLTPYEFVITTGGRIQQAISLHRYGAHAKNLNSTSIGVCSIGDFREAFAKQAQVEALVSLTALLCTAYGIPAAACIGHGEGGLAATTDKTKLPGGKEECPGPGLSPHIVRRMVARELALVIAVPDLAAYGVVLGASTPLAVA